MVRSRPSDCVHCPHEEIQKGFVFPQYGYWGVIDSWSALVHNQKVLDRLLSLGLFLEHVRLLRFRNDPNQGCPEIRFACKEEGR